MRFVSMAHILVDSHRPPTPKLQRASNEAMAAKFGALPAIKPQNAVSPRVMLKAHLLPKISHPKPQLLMLEQPG
jgi:hypothetical protein